MVWLARPAALDERLDHLLDTSPVLEGATLGLQVVQLSTGTVLYTRNADRLLVPASNTKLFTSALALMRLGPDYRMKTRLWSAKAPTSEGRIAGDLTLTGGGDPSMSFEPVPYAHNADPANPLAGIELVADGVVAAGVRRITGNIIGDDTAYRGDPFPPGWAIDDTLFDYGAPVSALPLASNFIQVQLTPAPAGELAVLDVVPGFSYYVIDNRVVTTESGDAKISVRRLGERQLELAGAIPTGHKPVKLKLAVDDPALFAATALYDALTRRGIAVDGHPSALHRYGPPEPGSESGVTLAERASPPLAELLKVMDKESQNLWAELMLCEVARVRTGDGSREAGLKELTAFLTEIGIPETDHHFTDGSGLSRMTLVKPRAIVQLLTALYNSPLRDLWIDLLPIGGVDGTLDDRFLHHPEASAIHAKTGTLSHVRALSGYVRSGSYGEVAFSMILNDTLASSAEVKALMDGIALTLVE